MVEHKFIGLHPETYQRLKDAKPYDSMSFNEMVSEALDAWEEADA